jgi:6-pyruvoyltetrahydropterin/6-carboxytetrahydropterin synthase
MHAQEAGMVTLCRKVSFSCAHRYYQPGLSESENRRIYGSLYSEHGHGHNYILEAHVEGPIDWDTGMVINLKELDSVLKEITSPMDHHHLNFDLPYFQKTVPTTENIAVYCFEEIDKRLAPPVRLRKVRLQEGTDLWVECTDAG